MGWRFDTEAIAVAAKYIGIALTAALGIIGTVTDTKDKREDGSYEIRPIGWFVAVAIVVSSIVGAIGQFYDDRNKDRAEAEQIRRLQRIADTGRRSLLRFSGKLQMDVILAIGAKSDPALRGIALDALKSFGSYDHMNTPPDYMKRLKDISCSADLLPPKGLPGDRGYAFLSLSPASKYPGFGSNSNGPDATVFVNQRMDTIVTLNQGVLGGYSDIIGREIRVRCSARVRGSDQWHRMLPAQVNLIDADNRVEFGKASFDFTMADSDFSTGTIVRSPWLARFERDEAK